MFCFQTYMVEVYLIVKGIIELLEPGDSVMADKGFTIADLLSPRGVALNIPPTKTEPHFSAQQLIETRRTATVRIHVERAIRQLKTYRILTNNTHGVADQTFFVCTVLTNFLKPLV